MHELCPVQGCSAQVARDCLKELYSSCQTITLVEPHVNPEEEYLFLILTKVPFGQVEALLKRSVFSKAQENRMSQLLLQE